VTRIPADIDREDPLVFGLSARQLCILAAAAAVAWLLYGLARAVAPVPVATAAAMPVVAAGVVLALGQRDGMRGDRFTLALLRYLRSRHRLVPMTHDSVPREARRSFDRRLVAALQLPVRDISDEGQIDLGGDGETGLMQITPVNFSLRTAEEQSALVAGFARFLNSVQTPIQVVVRSERTDLSVLADQLQLAAPSLPHPSLETAARAHAAFLGELSRRNTVLHREVLLATRSGASGWQQSAVSRMDAMCSALAEAELIASRLDGRCAATVLQHAMTGEAAPLADVAAPGDVIRSQGNEAACG
jgi:PrgI family protein